MFTYILNSDFKNVIYNDKHFVVLKRVMDLMLAKNYIWESDVANVTSLVNENIEMIENNIKYLKEYLNVEDTTLSSFSSSSSSSYSSSSTTTSSSSTESETSSSTSPSPADSPTTLGSSSLIASFTFTLFCVMALTFIKF